MIRRGFWLVLGATGGIMGYRRVTALRRQVSGKLAGREVVRFARDVREGMDLYMARHPEPGGPNLRAQEEDDQ
ncbi:MAG: hypothetical protein JOY82_17385 [Streptosporangiaceae bacterium]|nr:hypothetical protein [Streptosporangiaceae bacterium]MBV9856266.1 hypothetical protein [Streptosporangiaceae bacterium]